MLESANQQLPLELQEKLQPQLPQGWLSNRLPHNRFRTIGANALIALTALGSNVSAAHATNLPEHPTSRAPLVQPMLELSPLNQFSADVVSTANQTRLGPIHYHKHHKSHHNQHHKSSHHHKHKPKHLKKHKHPSPNSPTLKNFNLAAMSLIPANVAEKMHQDTVWVLGSSGSLIRNQNNTPIGVLTDEHQLELTPNIAQLSTDSSGQPVLKAQAPILAWAGDVFKDLTPVGQVREFYTNLSSNSASDYAIGVFNGSTLAEVEANIPQMPLSQVNTLPQGTILYFSGWTDRYQSSLPTQYIRQSFAMGVLGVSNEAISNGKQTYLRSITALDTASPLNTNGAEVGPGQSGAVAVAGINGKIVYVGVLSAASQVSQDYLGFNSPNTIATNKAYIENKFTVDLTGFATENILSVVPPFPDNGASIVKVESPQNVNFGGPAMLKKNYLSQGIFYNQPRQIIDGVVKISTASGDSWIEKPVVYHDASSDSTLLVYYDPERSNGLGMIILDGTNNLADVSVYSYTNHLPALVNSTGNILPAGSNAKQFTDTNNQQFGEYGNYDPNYTVNSTVPPYGLTINNGQLALSSSSP